ncbi:MAG: HAMP domain-containing histidine kinase [Acidobacteria bacterium]|nr:HAMP domain-containing histidine kinase [Acidobacteriota bacterium]
MERRRPHVSSLGLYTSFYLVILGATYLILPPPLARPYDITFLEIRGSLYCMAGVALLWACIDAFGRGMRSATYVGASLLIGATAVDMLSAGRGVAAAHGWLGLLLGVAALAPAAERRRASLLGLALGGAQVAVGVDALFGGPSLPGIVPLGISDGMVATGYAVTGALVLAVSAGAAPGMRGAAHWLAGGVLVGHLLGVALTLDRSFFLTGAAAWFRGLLTLLLPRWERWVTEADSRTLRARTGAAFATVAVVAGVIPVATLVLQLDRSAGGNLGRMLAFGSLVVLIFAAGALGVSAIGARLARAIERAVEASTHQDQFEIAELDRVASAMRQHVDEVQRLGVRVAEQDDRVGGITHDLRNPLSVIATASAMLPRVAGEPPQVERLAAMIARQVARMGGLVENLLRSAQLESGRYTAHRVAVPVTPWLEDVRRQFALAVPTSRLVVETADVTALVDVDALTRIVTNLVDNALKFSPAEQPVVVRASADETHVLIAVVDHGPGIPAAERARLFERFHRRQETRDREGFGLGLTIAHRLAQENSGSLTIGDTPGGGATFTLRLERVAAEQSLAGSASAFAPDIA